LDVIRDYPSRIFSQDFGLPPFLERLESFSWPNFTQTSLLPPFTSKHHETLDQNTVRRLTSGVSEIRTGQNSWKINLDVKHFSPEEITVTTKDGYLQISGTHEERLDEHGLVSRCFSRKYKLPQGVDLQHISSSLSQDGMLSIEAPYIVLLLDTFSCISFVTKKKKKEKAFSGPPP
uniref:Heat shock protein beta-1-like n=1 Tax=Gouania willdenowi TaxID=441366 RepID=A0A8C5D9E4_GOUWI